MCFTFLNSLPDLPVTGYLLLNGTTLYFTESLEIEFKVKFVKRLLFLNSNHLTSSCGGCSGMKLR